MSIDIIMPPLSQTMDTLVLLEWAKKLGDPVQKGETLFTVETDKASLEVESPGTGILFEVHVPPNSEVKIGSVIGKILEPGEKAPVKSEVPSETPLGSQKTTETIAVKDKGEYMEPKLSGTRLFVSPRARCLAEKVHLDLSLINPTGPRHMVVERDVLSFQQVTPKAA